MVVKFAVAPGAEVAVINTFAEQEDLQKNWLRTIF